MSIILWAMRRALRERRSLRRRLRGVSYAPARWKTF